MVQVLPRNTRLPARKGYELATTRDGQTELELQVFQGDSPKVAECEYLGTVRVPNLRPGPRGSVKVAVEFALGGEGILAVTARNLATGQVTESQFKTIDTPETLKEKLAIPEPQSAPRGARPLEPAPVARGGEKGEKKGLFGRLFGGKR
jgi:molecular chaperone DnaK